MAHVSSHTYQIRRADDLGSESGRHIKRLLQRVSKKQRKSRKLSPLDDALIHGSVAEAKCGAPSAKQDTGVDEPAWEDVLEKGNDSTHGLVVRLDANDVKTTKKKQTFTQEDRNLCKQMHRAHIMCLLARGVFMDTIANNEIVQATALSHIPPELMNSCFHDASDWSKSLVQSLTGIFHESFSLEKAKNMLEIPLTGNEDTILNDFVGKIGSRCCNVEECTVIFASLLRGLGYPVRLVHVLEPMAFRPGELLKQMTIMAKEYEKTKKGGSRKKSILPEDNVDDKDQNTTQEEHQRACDAELQHDIDLAIAATSWKDIEEPKSVHKAARNLPASKPTDLGKYWLEVFCGDVKSGEWIHCDPANGWVDMPERVKSGQKKKNAMTYVVAYSGQGAKDVTRRYADNFVMIQKNRDQEWWDQTMALLRRKERKAMRNMFSRGKGDEPLADLVEQRENKELEDKVAAETSAVPATIEGFKNHKDFVLKRHITKYQVLVPGCKVYGAHKGEPFYLKSNLRDIHTADRWKRLGRQVKITEIDLPCKLIKKKGAAPTNVIDGDADIGTNDQAMSRYYAEWQTEPWCPPAAKDGKVPKNDRGNVEVPPFAFQLPPGTVHVDLQHAAKVCKKLQIDFAPALTGFDIRSGRSVPRIEGVVVCQEFEELVQNACHEYVRHQAELAKQKRLTLAREAWGDFIKALLTHVRVHKSYAGDDMSLALLEHASLKKDPSKPKNAKAKKKTGTSQEAEIEKDPTTLVDMEEI